jgi:hypothetical protein
MTDIVPAKGLEREHVEKANIAVEELSEKHLNNEAHNATDAEHNITIFQALKTYRKAVLWSVLISTTVIMEGYDVTLLGSFMAYPAFKKVIAVPEDLLTLIHAAYIATEIWNLDGRGIRLPDLCILAECSQCHRRDRNYHWGPIERLFDR